jgi:hypothetical protein
LTSSADPDLGCGVPCIKHLFQTGQPLADLNPAAKAAQPEL